MRAALDEIALHSFKFHNGLRVFQPQLFLEMLL
jgi:hypothetical protein